MAMTETIKTDLLVIGAGSGGLSVAAGAVQMGAEVVLLEAHKMGGDCLNYGCVPSKALLAAAKVAHKQSHSAAFGIADVAPQVDYAKVMEHVADVISAIEPVDSQERFEGLGVRVIREFGKFVSPNEVEAGDYRIKARRVVIATGSSPLVPPIPGLADVPYLTNETLFDLREQPDHLIIIGGGPIGMEMAQAHIRLGSKVTVIEAQKALGRDDPEMAAFVLDALRSEGVAIMEGAAAQEIRARNGGVDVQIGDGRVVSGSHLLVAVGRKVNVEGMNLDAAGIETVRGAVKVGSDLRTTNRKVYAIGDAAGGAQFTHVAGYQAGVIIRPILFGLPAKAGTAHVPYATYTDPELAQVGMTEAEARETFGDRVEIVRFDTEHNDRARAERLPDGLIKVMVVKGRPVGASIVGPQAGELISLWSLAIAQKLKMSAIASMVAPYPTVAEINKRAAGAYFSPRLFENPKVKKLVRIVQRFIA